MNLFTPRPKFPQQVAAGKGFSLVIRDKQLFATGSVNSSNTFTPYATDHSFLTVSAYNDIAYGITTEFILLDLITQTPITTADKVFAGHSTFYLKDSSLYSLDHIKFPFEKIIKVSSTPEETFFLHNTGQVFNLDLETIEEKAIDISAPAFIKKNQTLSSASFQSKATRIESNSSSSSSSSSSSLITYKGKLIVQGSSIQGAIGLPKGHHPPTALPINPYDMAIGNSHSIILTKDNTVLTSGSNRKGELGLGHNNPTYEFTPAALFFRSK